MGQDLVSYDFFVDFKEDRIILFSYLCNMVNRNIANSGKKPKLVSKGNMALY